MAISLSSIAKTTRGSKPPRILIHGLQGVGKSTFGAQAYKPIFLPFEDGLSGLECDSFPLLSTYGDGIDALNSLAAGGHGFGTAVVDSADWLEPLIWKQVAKDAGVAGIEDIPYGKGYAEATNYWRDFFGRLTTLRDRGMAVIVIAHTEVKRFDAPDSDAYDRYQIKLHKTASALALEWADIVGFAQAETTTRKETQGFNNKRTVGLSTGRRLLRVVETAAYQAKNRYSLPDPLPLNWAALVQAITAGVATAAPRMEQHTTAAENASAAVQAADQAASAPAATEPAAAEPATDQPAADAATPAAQAA